jgi:V/A-type H+-transporting ATPase subunit A
MAENIGKIVKVSGPLVVATGLSTPKMFEVVRVSEEKLVGEIIEILGDEVSIQVYEDTSMIGPGDPVIATGDTMTVDLAPGLLEGVFDGIQRPLDKIEESADSCYISRGIDVKALDYEKKWDFVPTVKTGDKVSAGSVIGTVQETTLISHKIMLPPQSKGGTIKSIEKGSFNITEVVATLDSGEEVKMLQKWSIRAARPVAAKRVPDRPLITGGRSIDTFFPLVKGGAGCIPGPFGSGKTVTQQGLAKYCDAQVIVYVGCGERGNEMTDALVEFPHLKDPNTGEPLMKRTILIANTSNMPVAAREASIYTGITLAEYYRDMGYSVALMADSTSRWAEAMREMSGRLEEMPGEEGYPAYLGSRVAQFYERAGAVNCLGQEGVEGALTVVGAVSPPGGDLSEPVSQNTLRVTKSYWGLDSALSYKRHFPAINWLSSYSLYVENIRQFWKDEVSPEYADIREEALRLLQEESKLEEIVKLVGPESLSNGEKLTLTVAKLIREDFLFQDAFDPEDAYTPPKKQFGMLKTIMTVYYEGLKKLDDEEFEFKNLENLEILSEVSAVKDIPKDKLEQYEDLQSRVAAAISAL